ncbi:MAG: TolC family protein [Deltaproteobacteria bacterium]|nr:TolC family protein [Deltaproteobacteria bacterium]
MAPSKSIAADKVLKLSLKEAISKSLEANPEIEILRLDPELATQNVKQAESRFDTFLSAEASVGKDVSPSGSSLAGTEITDKGDRFKIAASKELEYGTDLELAFTNSKIENNSLFTGLSPEYASDLTLTLKQPILKGAWSGRPGILVDIQEELEKSAQWNFKAELSNQIKAVIEAYWNQKLAKKDIEVKQKSLASAEKFRDEADAGVSAGTQAPTALAQASAQSALRKEELIAAQNRFESANNQLRKVIGDYDTLRETVILELVDAPEFTSDKFETNSSLNTAIEQRPELRAQDLKIKSDQLNRKLQSQNILPELNLVGSVGVDGLSGNPQTNPFDSVGPVGFAGGRDDSLDSLGSGDYYEYTVGVEIKRSFGNSAAEATAKQAEIEQLRSSLKRKSLEQQVIVEVKNAVSDLETATQRIKAGKEAEKFAKKALDTGEERFKVGLSTPREVLELQEDLAQAELALATALSDYQIALAEIYRARGELLERYEIAFVNPKES